MEGVEEAHKAAVESCHKVLSLLSQPQDQIQYGNLMAETGQAVAKFRRVVSLLNNGLGHGRVRITKKFKTPFPPNIFLESPNCKPESDKPCKPLQFLQTNLNECPPQENGSTGKSSLCLGNPPLEICLNGKSPLQHAQSTSSHYQFLQQRQQSFQLQQQLKNQAEMWYRRSNSGINLNFDSSSCTPTMSSTRSFISSLSIDGSVANLNANGFGLIRASHSMDQNSSQNRKRCFGSGEDGSVKCG
ncbi:WRKY Transcription Factor [Ancistrocladus abbreviatus]